MNGRHRIAFAVLAILALLAALAAGWWIGRPAPVVETAAPEVTQRDGSKIAARAPNAKAKAKQVMPKGATLERTAEIEVQGVTPTGAVEPCPSVTIDTSLVRLDDGTKRLLISSPDGQITRAVDIPVETAAPPPEPPRWAAGLSFDPIHQTAGVWLERDMSRFRVGVDLNQTRRFVGGPLGVEARLRVGWTF